MAFPTLQPTSRNFDAGDYPVKIFKAQSGAEVRIMYGSKRSGMMLTLSYDNITDTNADSFVTHYDEVFGAYTTFKLPKALLAGWEGSSTTLTAINTGSKWRYAEPPTITSVRPGLSSVQVKLLGVL